MRGDTRVVRVLRRERGERTGKKDKGKTSPIQRGERKIEETSAKKGMKSREKITK